MSKKVFVFPGQGSQYVGMGSDLAQNYDVAADIFRQADQILGFPLTKLCFEGPAQLLSRTKFTQPAVFTTSIAVLEVLKKEKISYDAVTGHSLGEYTALVAAGVLEFPDALKLVQRRAELMEKSFPEGQGGMMAILGLQSEKVGEICRQAEARGVVVPANFNAPGQVVISGDRDGLREAALLARSAGAKRVIPLSVSGPFHSPLMGEVGWHLSLLLREIPFSSPRIPFVANTTGDYVSEPETIKKLLVEQVKSVVYWENSIRKLYQDGYRTFVEVGPGKVLLGLIKRIEFGAQVSQVGDKSSLEKVLAQLEGSI